MLDYTCALCTRTRRYNHYHLTICIQFYIYMALARTQRKFDNCLDNYVCDQHTPAAAALVALLVVSGSCLFIIHERIPNRQIAYDLFLFACACTGNMISGQYFSRMGAFCVRAFLWSVFIRSRHRGSPVPSSASPAPRTNPLELGYSLPGSDFDYR